MADISQITPRLWTGAALTSDADIDELARHGITDVIDARAEMDDAPLLAAHPDFHYLWRPTLDDGVHKGEEWFGPGIDFALAALSKPHRVLYCHCYAGVNRGPSMALAVMLALGWTRTEAEALIRAVRPQVGLRYADDAQTAIRTLGYA